MINALRGDIVETVVEGVNMIYALQRRIYGYSTRDHHTLLAKLEADREGMHGLTLTEYERRALDVVQLENRAYKHHYYLQKPLEQIARELGVSVRKVRAMCNRANLRRRDTHDLKG